jgi:hypothetical protein
MRYRPLDANGDYTIGQPWLVNSPACVAQAVSTRIKLWLGEWYVDTSDCTPWLQGIIGKNYTNPNALIQQRIVYTPGVKTILTYSSTFTGSTRNFTISALIDTIYSVNGVSTAPVTVTQ